MRNGVSVTGTGYNADWNSTDQIPQRAIDQGIIPRFGNIDPTDGGRTYKYSVVADAQRSAANSSMRATGYAFRYGLNLHSNFTYFLDDPVNGDQAEQEDRRTGCRRTSDVPPPGQLFQSTRGERGRRPASLRRHRQHRSVQDDQAATRGNGSCRCRRRDDVRRVRSERNRMVARVQDDARPARRCPPLQCEFQQPRSILARAATVWSARSSRP